MPGLLNGYNRAIANGGRFVHYTSAEVALSIFEHEAVWMRNAITMNDFREIEHGKACLFPAYQDPEIGGRLKEFLDGMFPGFTENFHQVFNSWLPHFEQDTYLTSLSEHGNNEDEFGRLSMWRAYGGKNGVALVLRPTPFMAETDALKAYSSPISYRNPDEFAQDFRKLVDNMIANREEVRAYGADLLTGHLYGAFRNILLCTKHPSFSEELEWRVIYSPTIDESPVIKSDYTTVDGIPQQIYKIPLLNAPEVGLHGADLDSILDRVIMDQHGNH